MLMLMIVNQISGVMIMQATSDQHNVKSQEALDWFILLRWCSILGQIFIVATAFWWLAGQLLILPISVLILTAVFSNIILSIVLKKVTCSKKLLSATIFLDVILLTGLLYFSGGPSNPFSIVYLVYIVLAAILMGKQLTWIVTLLATFSYGLLFFYTAELPWRMADHYQAHHSDSGFSLHLQGMWVAFVLAAILIAYFLNKILDSLKRTQAAFSRLEIQALKQQRLAALTTMAAGAAHELGTPLATVALVASEIEQSISKQSDCDLLADIKLINSEVQRCKSILEQMSEKSGSLVGEMPQAVSLLDFVTALKNKLSLQRRALLICQSIDENIVINIPIRAVELALLSLINNAFDASSADQTVELTTQIQDTDIIFEVKDNGSGITPENLQRMGEPFFSTQKTGYGLGLGVFLAQLTAEQLGGSLGYTSELSVGTRVVLRIQKAA